MNKTLKLERKNVLANTATKFEFDVEGYEFLVKNFNDFDIYVGFEETTDTSKMIKIPSETSQICVINKPTYSYTALISSKNIYVYAESVGEVEVQCIKY